MEGLPILLGLGAIFAVAGAIALFGKKKVQQIQEDGLRTEGFVWNLVKEQTNEWRYTIRFIGQDNKIHQASWSGTGSARLDDIVEIQYIPPAYYTIIPGPRSRGANLRILNSIRKANECDFKYFRIK